MYWLSTDFNLNANILIPRTHKIEWQSDFWQVNGREFLMFCDISLFF